MVRTELNHGRLSPALALLSASILIAVSLLLNNVGPDGVFLANEKALVEEGYQDLWKSPADVSGSIAAFESALRQDPASPFRWQDLGNALLAAGKGGEANYCFQRADRLAPHVPAVQMRSANFELQTGQPLAALASMRSVLEETAAYDEIIFNYYRRLSLDISDVLRSGIPETSRAANAFLVNSLSQHDQATRRSTWDWAVSRGLIKENAANAYVRQVILDSSLEDAASLWRSYAGARGAGHGETNLLYNSGFEYPLSGSLFDWTAAAPTPDAIRDREMTHSGKWSIRVKPIEGTQVVVSQSAVLQPRMYSLEAQVRGNGLSPGVSFALKIVDEKTGRNMAVGEISVGNGQSWTRVAAAFSVPSKTALVKISATVSNLSQNSGAIWIDDVILQPQE